MSEESEVVTVNLKQVKDRFDQSAETLTEARAKLDALTAATKDQADAADDLRRASSEVASFVTAAREAVGSLEKAQANVVESFDALKQLVEQSELKAVREGVDRINERLDRVTELESELSATKDELARVSGDYERLKGSVGSRALRKAGLE